MAKTRLARGGAKKGTRKGDKPVSHRVSMTFPIVAKFVTNWPTAGGQEDGQTQAKEDGQTQAKEDDQTSDLAKSLEQILTTALQQVAAPTPTPSSQAPAQTTAPAATAPAQAYQQASNLITELQALVAQHHAVTSNGFDPELWKHLMYVAENCCHNPDKSLLEFYG